MASDQYEIFTDSEEEYALVKPSTGNFVSYCEVTVKAAPVSELDKRQICQEMGWVETDEEGIREYPRITNELSRPEWCERLAETLFIGATVNGHEGHVNMQEVLRGKDDFLSATT